MKNYGEPAIDIRHTSNTELEQSNSLQASRSADTDSATEPESEDEALILTSIAPGCGGGPGQVVDDSVTESDHSEPEQGNEALIDVRSPSIPLLSSF